MTLWLDAQLPPALARWIGEQPWGVDAVAVRELGLRDASDPEIFRRARAAGAVVMTKDRDFIRLLDEQGPPPQVIWLRLGNSSNAALQLLRSGEPWVEIRPQANAEA
jgi:predicted nuclease of predicted toxin-antitoxin system